MAFDEHLRIAVDRILNGVRAPLEDELRAYTGELVRLADLEIDRVSRVRAEAVRREAHDALVAARESVAREVDAVRQAGQARLAELQQEVAHARVALEAARLEREDEHRRLVSAYARTEALEGDVARYRDAADAARRAVAACAAIRERDQHDAEAARVRRLRDGMRGFDDAQTLGAVLERLTTAAGREVHRAAVLVVRGGHLQGWAATGFGAAAPAAATVWPPEELGIAGAVVRTGAATTYAAPDPGEALPAFARSLGGRHATAVPLSVGGRVVGVLYGDGPYRGSSPIAPWTEALEVLSRHAGRVLETVTLRRALGVPAPAGDQVARIGHPEPEGVS